MLGSKSHTLETGCGRRATTWVVALAVAAGGGLLGGCLSAMAADLHVQPAASVSAPVVMLGDVIDLSATDGKIVKSLERIELGPAPVAGATRSWSVRQLQDALVASGVDLSELRFTGASRVEVKGAPSPDAVATAAPTEGTMAKAHRRVSEAIGAWAGDALDLWQFEFELSAEQVRMLTRSRTKMNATGPAVIEPGAHSFGLQFNGGESSTRMNLTVHVVARPLVVATRRPIAKGTILAEKDLELRPVGQFDRADVFETFKSVVGSEAKRTMEAGRVLASDDLRLPTLVRKGEVVTIYVRHAGVSVRTLGRAAAEGSLGDTILVSALEGRDKFTACVSGLQTVEIRMGESHLAAAGDVGESSPAIKDAQRNSVPVKQRGAAWRFTNNGTKRVPESKRK